MPAELALLTLEEIATHDAGRIGRLVQKHLAHLSHDCHDRDFDKSPRKLRIEISFRPQPNDNPAQMEIEVYSKVPVYRSAAYPVRVRAGGGFLFNREVPDDLDARALPGTVDEDDSAA
jgi:hypothetical protein